MTTSWCWRIPYIIQLVPAVYMLTALQFVPESPRFLLAHGRDEEAKAFLVKYHGNGDPDDELVNFEFQEMKGTIKLEIEADGARWRDVLALRSNRWRIGLAALLAFGYHMNGNGIIQYYYTVILTLVGITGATRQSGINAGLTMLTFAMEVAGSLVLNKMRRRVIFLSTWPMLLVLMVGICVGSAVFAESGKKNTHAGIATVAMVWFFSGVNSFSTPLMYSYPAEILCYTVRAKGMMVWSITGSAWGIYTSYVNSIGLAAIGWKYYTVYFPIIIIQFVLMYLYLVETKGYSLEQVAVAFEGGNAKVLKVDEEFLEGDAEHSVEGTEKKDHVQTGVEPAMYDK